MILADIDGNLLFYIIAAVIGLISWLTKKGEKGGDQSPSPKFPRPTVTPTTGAPQQSDDERVRKFLEALGVPADKQPPPPIQRKAATPAQREPPPLIRPVMAPLTKQREISKAQPIPPAIPTAAPLPRAAPSWEKRSLDEQGEPTLPVEQIHLPELSTHTVAEFVTESSRVSAIPFEASVSGEADAYGAAVDEHARPAAARVRALLGTPADLRAAIILREILGPAPGLQTSGTLPTFP